MFVRAGFLKLLDVMRLQLNESQAGCNAVEQGCNGQRTILHNLSQSFDFFVVTALL